jgi:hypothetical protein
MTKPKIPVYPRPVSPLNAEPLRAKPEDIYLDDSSDSFSDNEQNRAKRRRIEKLGEGYLRGDGLSIMTASLKGPWMEWVNPWSKRNGKMIAPRAGTLRDASKKETPESTLRISRPRKSRTPITSARREIPTEPSLRGHMHEKTSESGEPWLEIRDGHNAHAHSRQDDSPTPVRKHDYVRNLIHRPPTNNGSLSQIRPQPTSVSTGVPAVILKQQPEDEKLEPALTLPLDTRHDSRPKRAPPPQPGVLGPLPGNEVPAAQSDRFSVEHGGQQTTKLATPNGVLQFKLKSKSESIHGLPPLTHVPEIECRPVAGSLKSGGKPTEQPTYSDKSPGEMKIAHNIDPAPSAEIPIAPYRSLANDGAQSQKQADQGTLPCEASSNKAVENRSANAEKMPPPSTSTQTSATTTTNAMPSAQIVSAVQAPFGESYPSIASRMIEQEIIPTANKSSAHHSTPAKSTLPTGNERQEPSTTTLGNLKKPTMNGTKPNGAENIQNARSQPGIVPFSTFKSALGPSAFSELDTQEMMAAISPLGFSTVPKVPVKSANKSTPSTATQVNLEKRKKRASFAPAPDRISSAPLQGSIKGCLKVSKLVDKQAKTGNSLGGMGRPSLFGKLGLDMETSDEEEGTGEAGSLPGLASLLRGEPHPQPGPSSSGHLGTTNTAISTGSAQQQDAQQRNDGYWDGGQNGDERQDSFNLANAIDDLGSFLGTWDTDKEAKEFGSGMSNSGVKSALKSRDSMGSVRG